MLRCLTAVIVATFLPRCCWTLQLASLAGALQGLKLGLPSTTTSTNQDEVFQLVQPAPPPRIVEKFHVTQSGLNMQILCTPSPVDTARDEEKSKSIPYLALLRLYEKSMEQIPSYLPPIALPKTLGKDAVKSSVSRGKLRPPLLFVHGSYHSSWCYAESYLPHFARLGYTCYAISLRGTSPTGMAYNDQSKNPKEVVLIQEHVEDVREALDFIKAEYKELLASNKGLEMPRPVVIAHSFGGLIVMKLLEVPTVRAGLEGVCLLCSVPPSGNGPMTLRFLRNQFIAALKIVYGFVFKAVTFDTAIAREIFFDETLPEESLARYMGYFKKDSRVGLDLAGLRNVLPSVKSMDGRGRATWLMGAGEVLRGSSIGSNSSIAVEAAVFLWEPAAQKELDSIPFFVRGRIRGKTERYAAEKGLQQGATPNSVSLDVFLQAKKFYGDGGTLLGNTGTGMGTGVVYPTPGYTLNKADSAIAAAKTAKTVGTISSDKNSDPRILVIGGARDFIIDAVGTEETAKYLGVTPVVLPVYHDCMVGEAGTITAKYIEGWLKDM